MHRQTDRQTEGVGVPNHRKPRLNIGLISYKNTNYHDS